jgi:hypothetical protein
MAAMTSFSVIRSTGICIGLSNSEMPCRRRSRTCGSRPAMYHAVEARSPFLDSALWDPVARLPAGLRLRVDVLKAMLRKMAARHSRNALPQAASAASTCRPRRG